MGHSFLERMVPPPIPFLVLLEECRSSAHRQWCHVFAEKETSPWECWAVEPPRGLAPRGPGSSLSEHCGQG